MIKRNSILISSFFLSLIFLPLIADLCAFAYRITQGNEGQSRGNTSFVDAAKEYVRKFDTRFWGREVLVKRYISFKKDVLGVTPLPEKVIFGKDGWLFLVDYRAMDDYRNLFPFSESQLDSIRHNLNTISRSLHANGMKLYVTIVPDKHTIYPEYLPPYVKKVNSTSRLQQLNRYFNDTENLFTFVDLTDTLLASKKRGLLYYKKESHWNDLGALIGYSKILKSIKRDFADVQMLDSGSCSFMQGYENNIDLAMMLGESADFQEAALRIRPVKASVIIDAESGYKVPPTKQFQPQFAFQKINSEAYGPDILVFRDSYFEALEPFFSSTFPRSTYIWTTRPDLAYATTTGANIVVLEVAERHLYLLTH